MNIWEKKLQKKNLQQTVNALKMKKVSYAAKH